MIDNTCSNCKLQTVCKFSKAYTADRKNLLDAGAALPLIGSKTTVITVLCKDFAPTSAARTAEAAAAMQKLQQALAPLAEIGKAAANTKPDQGGGGQ